MQRKIVTSVVAVAFAWPRAGWRIRTKTAPQRRPPARREGMVQLQAELQLRDELQIPVGHRRELRLRARR